MGGEIKFEYEGDVSLGTSLSEITISSRLENNSRGSFSANFIIILKRTHSDRAEALREVETLKRLNYVLPENSQSLNRSSFPC